MTASLSVGVLGGGPAGLYLAYLLRRWNPAIAVTVHERSPAEATWGFGVVLADRGLRQLEEADPEVFAELSRALYRIPGQTFLVDGEAVPIDKARPGGAIERLTMLRILQRACRGVGVDLNFDSPVEDLGRLPGYDIVVAADGANSLVRRSFADAFGTSQRLLTNRFAWYGANRAFDGSFLDFRSVPGGALVGHYYPYMDGRSTFVMECDEPTWQAMGLEAMDDGARRDATERHFADVLGGRHLLENNSIWRRFPAITNQRWSHGRYVLIGDALRTAHFSIGSGTRMALEDAIVLARAIVAEQTPQAAFAAFQANRGPGMARLADAAERSYLWYERFSERVRGCSAGELALQFLRRTGRITPERLRTDFPKFHAYAVAHGLLPPEPAMGALS